MARSLSSHALAYNVYSVKMYLLNFKSYLYDMRTGLIVFGVIFLVLGALLYFVPTPSAGATVVLEQSARTWYASLAVPISITYAILAIGVILFILGLVLPGEVVVKTEKAAETPHIVKTKERIEGTGKNKKIVRETKEEYV